MFDNQFKRAIVAAHSDLVVMDGPYTWADTNVDSFPWLKACLKPDQEENRQVFIDAAGHRVR